MHFQIVVVGGTSRKIGTVGMCRLYPKPLPCFGPKSAISPIVFMNFDTFFYEYPVQIYLIISYLAQTYAIGVVKGCC